ncbi:hypothetical protein BN871_BE_00120 [Paenibacillus sp. P22]|nr:hypothetical protein BN871_BE_00120 [Paenibacillus sp. P22]
MRPGPASGTPSYWIGVVSASHVQRGGSGGFAQMCHGKSLPYRRNIEYIPCREARIECQRDQEDFVTDRETLDGNSSGRFENRSSNYCLKAICYCCGSLS